jgi:hypothetical protein
MKWLIDLLQLLFGKKEDKAPQAPQKEVVSPTSEAKVTRPYLVTKKEILMGRDEKYPSEYTQEISDNIDKLLEPINEIRYTYGKPLKVNSGWRPAAINEATANAGKASNHMKGLAVDFADPDGQLREWVLENLSLVASLGLYLEDFRWTKGWVHFQIVPPGSKKRIYVPSTAPMTNPDCWDGQYDSSLNY